MWLPPRAQGSDPASLERHFGATEPLVPMWIAEPAPGLALAPALIEAFEARARDGWYGYEIRPESVIDAFWGWMSLRHDWTNDGLHTMVSPSIGSSIGVMIEQHSDPGDGVITQPPVFTDFKGLITSADRVPVRNALELTDDGYRMDLDDLEAAAAQPQNKILILCSPHNPVGRAWTADELASVATICAANDVFVIADEVHADLTLAPNRFVPFATIAADRDLDWVATHGPIKTFGLAGVADTLVITDRDPVAERYQNLSSRLHLVRNNVFGLVAFETAYREGSAWFDGFLDLIATNVAILTESLPSGITLSPLEATYLAWLDLRPLGLEVPEIPRWFAGEAGLAISPGHWFGREGAGFARMTIATTTEVVEQAAAALTAAVDRR